MRLHLLLKCIFLLLYLAAAGQQAKEYAFTHFTTANGLASNFVNSIAQDKDGYLWLGTANGLQRFDGYRFHSFQSGKGKFTPLPSDDISKLYYDKKGNLWTVTGNNQVGIFKTRTFTYTPVPFEGGAAKTVAPFTIWEGPDDVLYLQAVQQPVYRYDSRKKALVRCEQMSPAPAGWACRKLVWDRHINRYWAATDSGLVLYNPVTQKHSYRNHNIEGHPAINQLKDVTNVLDLFTDAQGNLTLVTWAPRTAFPYLYHYNRQSGQSAQLNLIEELGLGYHEIGGLLQQKSGRLWISGRPFLAEWQTGNHTFIPVANEYRNEQSIRFDQVTTWFEDAENNMWIRTDNGLYFFNPDEHKFSNHYVQRPGATKAKEGPVHAILQQANGNIFVGTWNLGLYYYDTNLQPIPLPPALMTMQDNLSVWDLHEHSPTGNIWITLQGGGLVIYNPNTGWAEKTFPPIFNARTIRQVTEDVDGNLWFGTQSGAIIKWNFTTAGNNYNKGYQQVATTGLVHDLALDNRGYLWAATLSQGLLKIDTRRNKIVHTYTTEGAAGQRLLHNSPTDILQYNDSTLIVVSNGLNLINLNRGTISHLTTAHGLPSNTAYCIEKDANNVLWIGMANGLCRANLSKTTFILYDRRDGITFDNFVKNGAYKLKDGRLLFTTDHNFLAFDASLFNPSSQAPPVPKITAVKLSNKPLLVDSLLSLKKLSLGYDNNSIAIEFSGLNFLKQKQPVYYYKMEGLDKHWILAEGNNAAVYNHLPPGSYTFLVESRNLDGVFSEAPGRLQIEVNPPFWRTWWFYALLVLLFVTLLYVFDKERVQRLRALQQVRSDIAGNLHQEVNIALNDINLLSEIAKLKADKDIDRSKDYIDQISHKSRGMIEAMDDMLWSIDPKNDSMERLLLRLKEFTEGFKSTHGTYIELSADKSVQQLQMEMKSRYEFMHFYKEALNYAVQQSVCNTLYIGLEYAKPKLLLKILAHCSQVQPEVAESIQTRREMEKRAGLLNGALEVMEDKKSISIILQMHA